MNYQDAIQRYVHALMDIATVLAAHHEARTEFDPEFLTRIIRDGFLQPATDRDRQRLIDGSSPDESFLLWYGTLLHRKMNWNCLGWIFPFHTVDEMEQAYELIARAELSRKSWAGIRQVLLTCRMKLSETPFHIPTNFVKVRVKGEDCRRAIRVFAQSPPNVRYIAKSVLDRLPASHYFRQRTRLKIVVGEELRPYVRPPSKRRVEEDG